MRLLLKEIIRQILFLFYIFIYLKCMNLLAILIGCNK